MVKINNQQGYSLIELVVVLIIISVLAGVALSSLNRVNDTARYEETKAELDKIKRAIVGNPNLVSGGVRTDYGYVGDVGAMPPNLSALVSNPGGFATWEGPYLTDDFSTGGLGSAYLNDAWGQPYSYSASVTIASTGGPSSVTRELGNSVGELLYNPVSTVVTDIDQSPPGVVYKDSVSVTLIYPNGAGSLVSSNRAPAADGFVLFDSIPMGIQQLRVIYLPTDDTLYRRINVDPGQGYHADISFFANYWQSSGGGSGAPGVDTVLFATFTSGTESFTYQDDLFRSTSQPNYASGQYNSSGSYSGGGLEVNVGDVNNSDINDMSGGWQRTFNVPTSGSSTLTFYYNLSVNPSYESNEYVHVLVSIDGTLYGVPPNDYIDQLDGASSSPSSTGWQLATIDLGTLSGGNHTFAVGAYNNRKTQNSERGDVEVDNVLITVSY